MEYKIISAIPLTDDSQTSQNLDMTVMTGKLQSLLSKKGPIKRIGVVGMGYVGIPAAVLFADANEFDLVLGFQRASKTGSPP